MPGTELLTLIITGLAAGLLGGLLGIGGSILMIPVLTLLFHHNQHLSQAAAMIVNVFVAVPALIQHQRVGAVDWLVMRRILPGALVFIVIGVEMSNLLEGERLMRLFGVFLLYVIFVTVRKIIDGKGAPEDDRLRRGWLPGSLVGIITGLAAGLLGIGGGIIAVPLIQRIIGLPLRQCIACSTALMCVTAAVGAVWKNLALGDLTANGVPLSATESMIIAACLAPTAVIGGLLGARLTHKLPLRGLRIAFALLLCVACVKFLGLM